MELDAIERDEEPAVESLERGTKAGGQQSDKGIGRTAIERGAAAVIGRDALGAERTLELERASVSYMWR